MKKKQKEDPRCKEEKISERLTLRSGPGPLKLDVTAAKRGEVSRKRKRQTTKKEMVLDPGREGLFTCRN